MYMKRLLLSATIAIASIATSMAQTIYICKGGEYTTCEITDGLELSLTDGIDSITFRQPVMEKIVNVTFNGDKASVSIPSYIEGVTCSSGTDPNVVLTSTNLTDEITYHVSGSSNAGSLTINGDYKLTVVLDEVNLTSATVAPLNIQCGKRIAVVMADGSVNNFTDVAGGTNRACVYTKGHFEFSGAGTLNVTGNANHAIASKEYCQIKRSVKAINILKAANDAIHCAQYFQMNGGELNITSTTTSDAIQADYELDDNDEVIQDPENTGGIIIKGGTVNIELANAQDAKGLKAEGDIDISGGTFIINAVSNGTRGMQTDANMTISETDGPTNITVYAKGTKCTLPVDSADPHNCMGIKVDGNLTVNGGTVTVYNTGKKAKGIKVAGTYTVNGGTVNAAIDNGL